MKIQFQGVCYFRRAANEVTVLLPRGDRTGTHSDGTPAVSHHARLYVRADPRIRLAGFEACEWPPEMGSMFPLTRNGVRTRYVIEVSNQGVSFPTGEIDKLGQKLISLEKFPAPRSEIDPDGVAACITLRGGTFEFAESDREWRVRQTMFTNPAWNVIWSPGGDATALTEILISEGPDLRGSVVVPPAVSDPTIIVGNLDNPNAASWPLRENMDKSRCEDIDGLGRGPGDPSCYDNDFKWVYRVLQGDYSYDPQPGKTRLPAPMTTEAARVTAVQEGDLKPRGLDTPTCFPGTD